jgi:hypothetical protein
MPNLHAQQPKACCACQFSMNNRSWVVVHANLACTTYLWLLCMQIWHAQHTYGCCACHISMHNRPWATVHANLACTTTIGPLCMPNLAWAYGCYSCQIDMHNSPRHANLECTTSIGLLCMPIRHATATEIGSGVCIKYVGFFYKICNFFRYLRY